MQSKKGCPRRNAKDYHTGFDDHLIPLKSIDLNDIGDFDEMLQAMSRTAFGGRRVGEAADTLFRMITDKDTFVVLTLSGAMTPAKMSLLICEMMDRGFVHAVISTGALMTHGFVESAGFTHFKYDPRMDDVELYNAGYNRITDVLEPEKNLDEVEAITHEVLNRISYTNVLSSRIITEELGRWLARNTNGRGVLKSAFLNKVPVYVPAFTDSELGLDFYLYNLRRITDNKTPVDFNPMLDVQHYSELINQQKKIGIFTIGGGVPRNWAQQVAPLLELIRSRMPPDKTPKHIKGAKFSYGLRICPEPVHWGGLSGCTYAEGMSWGKMEPEGTFTEVLEDATVVWPWILKAVIQRLDKQGLKANKNFKTEEQLSRVLKLMRQYDLTKNR